MNNLNYNDSASWAETIWNALDALQDSNNAVDDAEWDDVCTAMAWFMDSLDIQETDDGSFVSN